MVPSIRSTRGQLPSVSRQEINSPAYGSSSPIQTGVPRSGLQIGNLHFGRDGVAMSKSSHLQPKPPLRTRIRSMFRSTVTPATAHPGPPNPETDTTKHHELITDEQTYIPGRERWKDGSGMFTPLRGEDPQIDEGTRLWNSAKVENRRPGIAPVGRLARFVPNKSQRGKEPQHFPKTNGHIHPSLRTARGPTQTSPNPPKPERCILPTRGGLDYTRSTGAEPSIRASFSQRVDRLPVTTPLEYASTSPFGKVYRPSESQLAGPSFNPETHRPGDACSGDSDSTSLSSFCSSDTTSSCSGVRRAWVQSPKDGVLHIGLDLNAR